mgnify:FL=1
MIYEVIWTSRFKQTYKLAQKRGLPMQELKDVVEKLRTDQDLDESYRDHELKGSKKGIRELHIKPDWLLCYKKTLATLTLTLISTGSHSDIFKK